RTPTGRPSPTRQLDNQSSDGTIQGRRPRSEGRKKAESRRPICRVLARFLARRASAFIRPSWIGPWTLSLHGGSARIVLLARCGRTTKAQTWADVAQFLRSHFQQQFNRIKPTVT